MVVIIDDIVIGTQQNSIPRIWGLGTTLPSENENDLLEGYAVQEVASHPSHRLGGVCEGDRKGTEALRGQPDNERPKLSGEGAT